jgi:hypothetical protein
VLELPAVDAGGGWLIFALPPAELGFHPAEVRGEQRLYLRCDEVNATVADLQARGAEIVRPISKEGFGLATAVRLPGGAELGLYQAAHPSPQPPARLDHLYRPPSVEVPILLALLC